MLLVTVTIWAFNFTVTKYAFENGFKPLAYSSVRFTLAGLLFAGLTYAREVRSGSNAGTCCFFSARPSSAST